MHFLPKFELVVVMPTYLVVKNGEVVKRKGSNDIVTDEKPRYKLNEGKFIEASVEGTFVLERLAMGNVTVRWFAKKIDDQTPMYNDTVSYREVLNLKLFFILNRYYINKTCNYIRYTKSYLQIHMFKAIQLQKKGCQYISQPTILAKESTQQRKE